jgi:hypothetical protein
MTAPSAAHSAALPLSPRVAASARRLAILLAAFVLIGIGPAWLHVNLVAAPNWARVLLLSGSLLLAYLAWMSLAPCRETLWSICWTFALAAAASVLLLAIVLFTSPDRPLPLGITTSRWPTIAWCGTIATLLSTGSLLTGRLAHIARP